MIKCPMCSMEVVMLKKNCHVLPRAFVKRIKNNGKNVELNFSENEIKINQTDYKDDFWCDKCEMSSSLYDKYGADVLIHKKKGCVHRIKAGNAYFRKLSKLDYLKFKNFILAIVIRDHLARILNNQELLMTDEVFTRFQDDYFGKTDELAITGYYLVDQDPISKAIHLPVNTKLKNGVNFQLLNFNFCVYFQKEGDLSEISLENNGELLLIERTYDQTGNHSDLDENYKKIIENNKNKEILKKIRKFK